MDEFFEIITLIQTKKISRVPVVCIGKDYWGHVTELVNALRDDHKVIDPEDVDIFHVTDNDDEVIEFIKKAQLRRE